MPGPLRLLGVAGALIVDVSKRWYHGGIGDLAAGVTFWIFLTAPAAVLALVAGVGSLDQLLGQNLSNEIRTDTIALFEQVLSTDAPGVADTVNRLFDQGTNGGLITFSIAVALWTISRGFSGMIRALDDVYEVEHGRAWYYTRVVALVLGLGSLLVPVPIALLEIFVWSRVPNGLLGTLLPLGSGILILVLWASLLFHYGPSIRTKWRWDLPGAIVAASFWWLLAEGFRFYVAIANGRNEVITAVGAFLLALTWVWLVAQVLLIGAAVNASIGERLGLDRSRREWKLPDAIFRTGEMRRIDPDLGPPDERPQRRRSSGGRHRGERSGEPASRP
ncbi:MAG: YihY/virulence factor BrkB family protein [Acidimicrobiales bacterium]